MDSSPAFGGTEPSNPWPLESFPLQKNRTKVFASKRGFFSHSPRETTKRKGDHMLLTISVTVIAASILVVVFFLIPVLLQFYRTSCELKKLIETLNVQIEPLSRDLNDILRQTRDILQSIGRQVDQMEEGVSAVRDIAVRLQEFQKEIQERIFSLLKLAGLVGAVSKGLPFFVKFFRR
jgi:uncharacterized protein YoxC